MILHDTAAKLEVAHCDLSGSRFEDVKLADATFNNVDMSGWRVEDVTLAGSRINNANLSGVSITNCAIEGMTLDGIRVTDLMAAYRDSRKG